MDQKSRIKKLSALKEELARKQAALVKAKALRETAEATGLASLLEADLSKAEQILAGQDITAKLQDMVEDLAQLSAKQVLTLSDQMKETFGPEEALEFEHQAQDSLTSALAAMRNAKDTISTSLLKLEGKVPANDMAADDHAVDNTPPASDMEGGDEGEGDEGLELGDDDFGGAEAASGPKEEPLGRALKDSRQPTARPLTEDFDLAVAGRKLLESEDLGSLVAWALTEAAVAMPAPQFKSFARDLTNKAQKSPEKTAGWIGKKKYGAAAMAQLAAPTITADTSTFEAVVSPVLEGKTFKDERYDDDGEKAERFKSRKQDRERKVSNKDDEDLDEGKSWRRDSEDEQEDDEKAEKFKSRKQDRERKAKSKDEMSEAQKTALAMSKVIEANILTKGKGMAAQVVKEMASGTLAEGEEQTVLEAFEEMFGMRPAQFSIAKARELSEDMPLSMGDQKVAAGVMGKLAANMAKDKTLGQKSTNMAFQGLDPKERQVASKMQQSMKADGKPADKVQDFVSGASSEEEGDNNSSTNNSTTNENINAAHWPINKSGQYKGDPMQTDYMKLKEPKKKSSETAPKSDDKKVPTKEKDSEEGHKVEEPKVPGSKAPAPAKAEKANKEF